MIDGFYSSPVIPIGPIFQYQAYNGWPVYPGMQLIVGLAGVHFANYSTLGLELSVDTAIAAPTLTLSLKNIYPTTVSIPKLEAIIFSISQYRCPNNELFIDSTRTQCLTSCPTATSPSPANLVNPSLR